MATILRLNDLVDSADIWVRECCNCSRLYFKSSQMFFVFGENRRQKLEGNIASQAGVFGEINFAHSTGSKHRDDAVLVEPVACTNWRMFAGYDSCCNLERRCFDEIFGVMSIRKQRFNFASQCFVASASLDQKRGTFTRLSFQGQ